MGKYCVVMDLCGKILCCDGSLWGNTVVMDFCGEILCCDGSLGGNTVL